MGDDRRQPSAHGRRILIVANETVVGTVEAIRAPRFAAAAATASPATLAAS
jgi:hypothetical protein